MIKFFHPKVGPLNIRLNPTSVKWSYNLVSNIEDTYGGQVIQILSVNIGQLTISGRLGKEGRHGRKPAQDKKGNPLQIPKSPGEFWTVDNANKYGNGLSQIWKWFATYFQVASQGGGEASGHYNQTPVELSYGGAGQPAFWRVFPVSFPSFKMSNENFAPEWQVVCEVEEADHKLKEATMQAGIAALKENTGVVDKKYSQPDFEPFETLEKAIKKFRDLLPGYSDAELEELIMFNASLPFWIAELSGSAVAEGDGELPSGTGDTGSGVGTGIVFNPDTELDESAGDLGPIPSGSPPKLPGTTTAPWWNS